MTDVADVSNPNRTNFEAEAGHYARENGGIAAVDELNGLHDRFTRDLLGALLRFKDGDFSSRMRSDLTGTDGKIADVFNEILNVSARRSAEIARVCRVVGMEGKLKQRMSVPGA